MNIFKRISEHFLANVLGIRLAPKTIQLPITSYCNSKCKTCNIWKLSEHQHIDCKLLEKALKDSYFDKVESVGINGGEPSLNSDFVKIIEIVCNLKSIKDIYVISNGMVTTLLLDKMSKAKEVCSNKNVSLHLTISLDGTNEVDNEIRGITNAFDKTMHTITTVSVDQNKYCDYFDVGYTISKGNATHMISVKTMLESIGIKPYFHIAVPNKRIHTFLDDDYSILYDKRASYLAREFFYSEFVETKGLKNKFKNFINFYYLSNENNKRIAMCNYLKRDITIDEKLNVYLCATASDCVGNLKNSSISELKKNGNLDREVANVQRNCDTCIHYAFAPTFKGMYLFMREKLAKINLVFDLLCARLHI